MIVASLTLLFAVAAASTNPYCKLSCHGNEENTMCKYPKPGQGPLCHGTLKNSYKPLVQKDVLDWHNDYRNKFAAKAVPGQILPGAANMRMLSWDDELAEIVERWISQCYWGHDKCRRTAEFTHVGQNLGYVQTHTVENSGSAYRDFKLWVDEMEKTPASAISSYHNIPNTMIGHFTQVIWAETAKVGCAQVEFKNGTSYTSFFGCNYGPGGNMISQAAYKPGEPCSACPSGTACVDPKYKNLCVAKPQRMNSVLGTDESSSSNDSSEQVFGDVV